MYRIQNLHHTLSKHLQIVFTIILLQIAYQSKAQEIYQFKNGLVAGPCHQYAREAIYKDELAYQLYNQTLKKPASGQQFFTNEKGESIAWKSLQADTGNKFKDHALFNGYLYLSYNADNEKIALLNITSNSMVYVNGEPRGGDLYGFGYLNLPVQLKKGLNEFYIRGTSFSLYQGITAKLIFTIKKALINPEDPTLPNIVIGKKSDDLLGAVVIENTTKQPLTNLKIKSQVEGKEITTSLPPVPAMSIRKVPFHFNAENASQKGDYNCMLSLLENGKELDKQQLKLQAVNATEDYSNTFISAIDGSVQYYSVSPQLQPGKTPPDLYLSVHGAGVEAIGQAKAYKSKTEGVLVTPTNRRPRGFNWEDWGRIDALEVLDIAKNIFHPDPQRIYLTGHSMGGHGTWYLGATYAGKWAAIAPCSGYPTLAAYGSADGKIPDTAGKSAMEHLLLQASNASNVLELAQNYNAGGVYIHHGDSDKVVSVEYARQMHRLLATFHKDVSYHEQPGGEHWYGDISVDWPPIFEYFKWHTIPADSAVNEINFTTANPAISAQFHWASILKQQQTLKYSRMKLSRNKTSKIISGSTENIALLSFNLNDFKKGDLLNIVLDHQNPIKYMVRKEHDVIYLDKNSNQWKLGNSLDSRSKGTNRNGTFKEPFNYQMIYVYGTKGNAAENTWAYNKARYDAESWYYRGNGAVTIIADKDFNPKAYPDRGIIIYGNATTNSAYKTMLKNCPVIVNRGSIKVGNHNYNGDNLAAYFIWPRADSKKASVAIISGTGLKGMQAADANQYFAAGSGFPDYIIFSVDLLKDGAKAIKQAGFYGNDWSLQKGQTILQ